MQQQLADHYTRLHRGLAERGTSLDVSMGELADLLCCTTRNVNLVLKRMAQLRWIDWQPGRGRGKRSELTFRLSLEQLYLELSQELVRTGNVSEALVQMSRFATLSETKKQFLTWLQRHFGYHVETREEKQVDTLRFPFYRDFAPLDPAFIGRRSEAHMARQIFDGLVRFNVRTGQIEGHLAHAWEVDADGREWLFYLRKGVVFHNGEEMTARDVMFSLQRLIDERVGSPFRWMFSGIAEMEVVRDTVLRVRLREADHLFLNALCALCASVVPREMGREFARMPVGTGPFQVVQHESHLFALEVFSGYFLGRAHLDRIEMWILPDWHETAGEHSSMQYVPSGNMRTVDSEWVALRQLEKGSRFLAFNLKKNGPLQDPILRKALRQWLDPERMVVELGGNRARRAAGWGPSEEVHAAGPGEECNSMTPQGETLQLYTYQMQSLIDDANWIQEQARQKGVDIEITVWSSEELRDRKRMQEADMILSGEVMGEDVELSLVEVYATADSSVRNCLSVEIEREIDARIAAVRGCPDGQERWRMLAEIEERLQEECALLFLYHVHQTNYHHSSLRGVEMNASGQADYRKLWLRVPGVARLNPLSE